MQFHIISVLSASPSSSLYNYEILYDLMLYIDYSKWHPGVEQRTVFFSYFYELVCFLKMSTIPFLHSYLEISDLKLYLH